MPLFDYPTSAHARRHGPAGYEEYQSYKPWLRDEFTFRCVYCFFRERWSTSGSDHFSVEHVIPKSTAEGAAHITDYQTLLYACLPCNSKRNDNPLPVDPRRDGLGNHLQVRADGTIEATSAVGNEIIATFGLDRPRYNDARAKFIRLFTKLSGSTEPAEAQLLQDFFGFPPDMPDLSRLLPRENNRPAGVTQSYFARLQRNELPATY